MSGELFDTGGPRATTAGLLRYRDRAGRWVLVATVLGSSLAFIDGTVVNIALPRIGQSLGASAAALQWTVNGYALGLAALVLLGGALGDRYGRRRTFVAGVVWFALASLACGLAVDMRLLVAARALQGVGGALVTPGALAIIGSSFHPDDRARAIGAWSGLAGIAGAVGPFLGGWLVQVVSWRFVFLINLPVAAAVVVVARRHVPETRDPAASGPLDAVGALTAAVGLGGITYGLTAWPAHGGTSGRVLGALALGLGGMLAFLLTESRAPNPMLPLGVFSSRPFTAANLVTLAVYAALGGMLFLLGLELQVVAGFSPLAAGTAMLPVTALMLVLSPRAGALSQRVGARLPMTVGPLCCAAGLILLSRVGADARYVRDVLPGVVVMGLGLSATVAPLTATALGALGDRHAGLASGVNNAVARAAGLLAVAALPLVSGLGAGSLTDAAVLAPVYRTSMLVCAGLLACGAALALAGVPGRSDPPRAPSEADRLVRGPGGGPHDRVPASAGDRAER